MIETRVIGNVQLYRYRFSFDSVKFERQDFDSVKKEFYLGDKLSHTLYDRKGMAWVMDKSMDRIISSHNGFTCYSLDDEKMEWFKDEVRKRVYSLANPYVNPNKKEYNFKEMMEVIR